MKKLLAVLVLAAGFTTSIFAVNFSVGGNLNAGGTTSDDSNYSGFTMGTGAFVNADFFLGLGVQTEVNLSVDNISIQGKTVTVDRRYEIIDIPFMLWWNGKFGPIGLGGGAGLNISGTSGDFADDTCTFGAAAGVNVIFYIGNHFGIVVGAHGVMDFTSRISVEKLSEYDDSVHSYTINSADWKRRSIYGTIGAEYRF